MHLAVIDLHDDNSFCDTGFTHFAILDGSYHQSVAQSQLLFLSVAEWTQGSPHLVATDAFNNSFCALHVAQCEASCVFLLVSQICNLHLISGSVSGHKLLQLSKFFNGIAINGYDNITFLQATFSCCSVLADIVNIDTGERSKVHIVSFLMLFVQIDTYILSYHTQHGTLHSSEFLKVVHHFAHDGGRNSKAIAAIRTGLRINHSIDTNEFAASIDKCSS